MFWKRLLGHWLFSNKWYVTPSGTHRMIKHPKNNWTTHKPGSQYGLQNCLLCREPNNGAALSATPPSPGTVVGP